MRYRDTPHLCTALQQPLAQEKGVDPTAITVTDHLKADLQSPPKACCEVHFLCIFRLLQGNFPQNILMRIHAWNKGTKGLLVLTGWACMIVVWLEACQSCKKKPVAPEPGAPKEEAPEGPPASTVDLGGIPNIGHTCFMNAMLQVLAKLYPDVLSGKKDDLARAGQVIIDKIKNDQEAVSEAEALAFFNALKELVNKARLSSTRAVGKPPPMRLNQQEDASEMLQILFGELKLPVIQLPEKIIDPGKKFTHMGSPPETTLNILLLDITGVTPPLTMQALFDSQFKGSLSEDTSYLWQTVTITNEDQTVHEASITANMNIADAKAALEKVFPDTTNYNIEQKDTPTLLIKGNVNRVPRLKNLHKLTNGLLPIHPNRTAYDAASGKPQKISTPISKPFDLTIKKDHQVGGTQDLAYELVACIHHVGTSAKSGHYVACIKRAGQWTKYDDSKVTPVPLEEVEKDTPAAYLFFYKPAS